MRFITGPRQCGKTTLARQKLERENALRSYYLWDLRDVRDRYKANQLFFTADTPPVQGHKQWVCFDEIHKIPGWKNALKAIFDETQDRYQFIVTGSAKLNILKKAGDSLAGRYFSFQLFPLGLWEICPSKNDPSYPPTSAVQFIEERMASTVNGTVEGVNQLIEYGGFPEPFTQQSKAFCATWSRDYLDTVVKEDIGALTRIVEKERLVDLYNLLPEMTGNPLSESSLVSHLELSNPTVKNHLRRLEDFFLAFKVHPYSKNIKRSLLKAPKCFLLDWTKIEDPGTRFENFMAVQLAARLRLWQERSGDEFGLFYLRNKQKQETDFLILRNRKPWMMVEAKLADGSIESHHFEFQKQLGGIPLVQVCRQSGAASLQASSAFRLSADKLLA